MRVEPIEAAVLRDVFLQKGVLSEIETLSNTIVLERNFSGKGFLTEFDPSGPLKIGEPDYNDRWLNTHATLNTNLDVGFLVYIDNGSITAIEGFTYGEIWPDSISCFEIKKFEVNNIPPSAHT